MKQQQKISLSDLDFGNRLRVDYGGEGELEEFAEEIKRVGLIHPVTVVDKKAIKNKEGLDTISTDDNKRYLLMAGGRRTKAYIDYNIADEIPAYVFPHLLTADKIREIELLENLQRKELSWQERVSMTEEIHELQQRIHGESTTSGRGHGLKDTAELIGKSKSSVHRDIELASALKAIPELAEIKDQNQARKILKELKKSHKAETKAKKIQKEVETKTVDERKTQLMNSFVVGDFFEHAEKLKDNTFTLIEIDPPYGIDLSNKKKGSKHKTLHYNEVEAKEYRAFMKRTLLYAKKLLRKDGWLVLWYAIDPWHAMMVELLDEVGFQFNEIPALWIKNGGQTMQPERYFASTYEPFLYARMSKTSKLNKPGAYNYLEHPKVASDSKFHPTQRPISLMEDVIDRFVTNGPILVPFAGSGVTLRAAHNLGIKAIGYDLTKDAKNHHDIVVNEQDLTEKFTL